MKLKIAEELSLPIDAATQTFAFIARKGAGKTYTAGKLVELLLEASVQVVVLDTVGNWYGLRLAADGKGKGFDVPVLGGLRGDIPLESGGGALIADIAVDTGRSMVLDISQWSKADRQRFAAAFGERLWLRKKGERHPAPVHLVIEESQLIVPQDVRGDTATMVGVYEEIIRLGRNYGIGVSMITQRPQSVNKEVLNQTECLFVGQVNGSQERDALKKWITHQGMDPRLIDELPSLKIGTFYIWSPQWLTILEKVHILPKMTFDASATPKVGENRVRRDLKPLDLADLQEQLQATIEKQKADDPRELRKRIAELQRQIAARPSLPVVTTKTVERRVFRSGEVDRLEKTALAVAKVAEKLAAMATEVLRDLRAAPPVATPLPVIRSTPVMQPHRAPKEPVASNGSSGLDETQQRILDTVLMLNARGIEPTREAVARWQDLHPSGGRYGTNLGYLRKEGYLDGFALTEKGLKAAREMDTGFEAAKKPLDGTQVDILETLRVNEGKRFSRDTLAAALSLHPSGGRFGTNLGRLRTMGLIPERGDIYLTEAAFR